MEEIYKVPARVCSVLEHGSLAEGSRLPAAETLKKVRNVILTGCGGGAVCGGGGKTDL